MKQQEAALALERERKSQERKARRDMRKQVISHLYDITFTWLIIVVHRSQNGM